jgi:hypothetical protein
MKMSSRRALLELGSVAQHRPYDVDPPTRQGDEGLRVSLVLGPRLCTTTQAGKGRLVEDPFLEFVPSSPRMRRFATRLPESRAAGTRPA